MRYAAENKTTHFDTLSSPLPIELLRPGGSHVTEILLRCCHLQPLLHRRKVPSFFLSGAEQLDAMCKDGFRTLQCYMPCLKVKYSGQIN